MIDLAVLGAHSGGVAKVASRADGTSLVSSGADRAVRLYDTDGGNCRLRHGRPAATTKRRGRLVRGDLCPSR